MIILIGIPLLLSAQNIPNRDFEAWDFNSNGIPQPYLWETQNEAEQIFVEALPGFSGNHSACLNIVWDQMLKKYIGAILRTEFNLKEQKRFEALSGFYRGNTENTDTLFIEVSLLYGKEVVAKGALKIMDISTRWKPFFVPIHYFSKSLPDKASISISIQPKGAVHFFTTYCIDDLLLVKTGHHIKNILSTNDLI